MIFIFSVISDIRKLYWKAGVENKPTVFLFTDTQVVEESFLEDINNILSSGEVPNLYKAEEFEEVRTCTCIFFCEKLHMYSYNVIPAVYLSHLVTFLIV